MAADSAAAAEGVDTAVTGSQPPAFCQCPSSAVGPLGARVGAGEAPRQPEIFCASRLSWLWLAREPPPPPGTVAPTSRAEWSELGKLARIIHRIDGPNLVLACLPGKAQLLTRKRRLEGGPEPDEGPVWWRPSRKTGDAMRWTDALFSSPRCGLELPAAQIGGGRAPVAGCVSTGRPAWLVDPPETRWAGGWGTPPSRPSNQGRPGGTRGGSASPHWLAVNKRGPTPCKHASLESWERSRCCPTVPRQPWRPSAAQQFDPSPLDSRPP